MARQLDSQRPSARSRILFALLGALLALSLPVRAQTAAAAPPPVSSTDSSAAPAAPAAATGSDYECTPTCRIGFVCVMRQCVSACNPACPSGEVCRSDGRCVSACNPPCGAGETCTAQGQCLATAPQSTAPQSTAPQQPAPSFDEPRVTFMPGADTPADRDLRSEDSASERRRTGKKFHNGFYLRLGVGAGYLLAAATDETEGSGSHHHADGGQQGFTVPFELAIGGSPTPGFVLGGGWWQLNVPAGEYTVGRGDMTQKETAGYGGLTMLGPFMDLYPAPRAGFHLQAAPTLALLYPGSSGATGQLFGAGYGLMAGLGYEGWVSDNWGLGVLARVQFFSATLTNADSDKYSVLALAPSLLMTTTFN
jgi:hypothetical protein